MFKRVIYELLAGKMVEMSKPRAPLKANFVICCNYGDWSGFRTLVECITQFKALELSAANMKRPDGYYWVEER